MQFAAYEDRQAYGSNIAAVDIDGDQQDEILLGEGTGASRPYTIRIFRQDGLFVRSWEAY